jgi:hypothetical protein
LAVFRTQAEIEAQNKAWVWGWYEAKLNSALLTAEHQDYKLKEGIV